MAYKFQHLQYYHLSSINAEALMHFATLAEMCRFVQNNMLKSIFVHTSTNGTDNRFAISYKGGVYIHATEGFTSLEDFDQATDNNFPDAATYYLAKKQGHALYSDYLVAIEGGLDKDAMEKVKTAGFVEGYITYLQALNEDNAPAPLTDVESAWQLYKRASDNGFENFDKWINAWKKGFEKADDFAIATERKFPNAVAFFEAQKKGFLMYVDYQFAAKRNLRDIQDVNRYIDLEYLGHTESTMDQRVLLIILSKLKQSKEYSAEKLRAQLEKECNAYRYVDTGEMPLWFTTAIQTRDDFDQFMTTNKHVKEFGQYKSDTQVFLAKKLSDRKVVLDGSNVAHNSQGNDKSKPYLQNIILMINELKRRGFTEIKVLSDASLKHRIEDLEKMDELKQLCEYSETPAETPADISIIRYVKRHHCLLISNDNFMEWKIQDSWIENNVDYYRIGFLITPTGHVMLPDLE